MVNWGSLNYGHQHVGLLLKLSRRQPQNTTVNKTVDGACYLKACCNPNDQKQLRPFIDRSCSLCVIYQFISVRTFSGPWIRLRPCSLCVIYRFISFHISHYYLLYWDPKRWLEATLVLNQVKDRSCSLYVISRFLSFPISHYYPLFWDP